MTKLSRTETELKKKLEGLGLNLHVQTPETGPPTYIVSCSLYEAEREVHRSMDIDALMADVDRLSFTLSDPAVSRMFHGLIMKTVSAHMSVVYVSTHPRVRQFLKPSRL